MAIAKARLVFWLAMAMHASTFAQVAVRPGQWELTGSFKGLPFGDSSERVRTTCLSAAALGAVPEKALMEAAPQPSDDASKPPPKCEYSQVRREGPTSSWTSTCESPTMTGTGSATTQPDQVSLQETLEMKFLGTRTIQHTVKARRLGDCT
ncbi:DUF3617 domain-containing protein [Variovorax sp. YR566]|uniref:DUF3617 domain-containing protein n=1 Tax=Variovorax sp. YR566 TaxID=3450237 RepID=UPI003F809CD1